MVAVVAAMADVAAVAAVADVAAVAVTEVDAPSIGLLWADADGAYQSTEPPAALALVADAAALAVSLAAAEAEPPALASSSALWRSSAIFLRSASSSCCDKADCSLSYLSRSANASSFALSATSASAFCLLFSAMSS